MALMPKVPTHCPIKMVSTTLYKACTIMLTMAGKDRRVSKGPMRSSANI